MDVLLGCLFVLVPPLLTIPLSIWLAGSLSEKHENWTKDKVALAAALPGALIVFLAGLCLFIYVLLQPATPGNHSGAYMLGALMTLVPIYSVIVLAIGGLAARGSL